MTNTIDNRTHRIALVGALVWAAVAVGGLTSNVSTAAAAPCPHADAGIDEATAKQHATAIGCLINRDRARHDRGHLANNSKLKTAAGRHNRTMLKKNCWDHDCPGEPGLGRRIRNTGYLDGARSWSYGETFGCATSPKAMLNVWLQNGFARGNIRNPSFKDVGIAAARDQVGASNCDDGNEITFTVVFARRNG